VGDAFGNPYSFADVAGVPYFYASDLDASMMDIFTSSNANPRVSFALSESQLTGTSAQVPSCVIGTGFNDPENPPCARLVLSGKMVKLHENNEEARAAGASLMARHPSFSKYAGQGFYIAKIEVDGIFFLDGYGGADYLKPSDYFRATFDLYAPHMSKTTPRGPPKPADQVGTARWMVHTLTYGALSTTSTRSQGSSKGDAFGNPYSFADVAGVPYFFGSDLDASMMDLFAASSAKPRASFALSEAQLKADGEIAACKIGTGFNDPENPPCARIVLSGKIMKVDENTEEAKAALASLVARHPSFSKYAGLGFYVVKMQVDGIFFLDGYGGADYLKPSDYFEGTNATGSLLLV
jgi:hypothetical protein